MPSVPIAIVYVVSTLPPIDSTYSITLSTSTPFLVGINHIVPVSLVCLVLLALLCCLYLVSINSIMSHSLSYALYISSTTIYIVTTKCL